VKYNNNDALMEELFAFDPKWQMHYRTIAHAARAASVLPLYAEWLKSADGVRYHRRMANVADATAFVEAEKRIREKELTIANQYAKMASR
jgi:hypothetical protein